jgi:HEAT repeat protein
VAHYPAMKDPLVAILQGGVQRPGATAAQVADMVAGDAEAVGRLVNLLDHADPRVRGGAADGLAALAERDATSLVAHVTALSTALSREETQTRVGAQRALAAVAGVAPAALEEEFDQIRLGAFDPANTDLRRHAALAIGRYGAGDDTRGRRAFPHLAEALRRFHDRGRAADLLDGFLLLAEAPASDWLKNEIWKSARKHEAHADPAVRDRVAAIARLVRPSE